ncbi:hypothetical protein RvY_18608 [Ramazzottius varieornatus]|uniref:mRNA decay factor PAT1 domain-containing protein n=1 Tax=Ramazzottius varieornatus TaxID=947166 RepID=A0A1D1W9J5_RAMVA|nr:hypothetical protein RvY_18608 [Ramazzottius varieornatus]
MNQPERDSAARGPFATTQFGQMSLHDQPPSNAHRLFTPGELTATDGWPNIPLDLNKINPREIFDVPRRASQGQSRSDSSAAFFGDRGNAPGGIFHDREESWPGVKTPEFFLDKEEEEERLPMDLSRLIDEDSFNSMQSRQDFFDEFTKQTYQPYQPRAIDSADSPWTSSSLSVLGKDKTWDSSSETSSYTPLGQDLTLRSTSETQVPHQQVPSSPSTAPAGRKAMTLEDLERMLIPQQPNQEEGVNNSEERQSGGILQGMQNPRVGGPFPPLVMPTPIRHEPDTDLRTRHPVDPAARAGPPGQPNFTSLYPLNPGQQPFPVFPPGMRPPQMHPQSQQGMLPNLMRLPNGQLISLQPQHHQQQDFRRPNGMPMQRGQFPQQFRPQQRPGFFLPPHGMMQHHQGPSRFMQSREFVNRQYVPDFGGQFDDEDECTGWMTEREKDWVIKIQQQQIKTENPYMDDYYFYVTNLKKMAKEGRGGASELSELDFIVPARMAAEPKEERSTMNHFEGSLGKVCISSVFNPRKTVDVEAFNIAKNRAPPSNQKRKWFVDPLQKEKGFSKSLLLSIEELYKLILELQDFNREVAALPEQQREQSVERRRNIINLMFDKLIQGTTPDVRVRNFCDTMKIRKGRELLRRVLPVLFKEQVLILTGYCVRALPILLDIPAERMEGFERCLIPVADSMKSCTFRKLVEMIAPIVEAKLNLLNTAYTGQSLLTHAVKNEFALSFLSLFVKRAEECYDTEYEALSEDDKEKWTLFVTYIFMSLAKTSADDVATVEDVGIRDAMCSHFSRFPFPADSVSSCKEKLSK